MGIKEKYEAYRKIAKDGDILLFRGTSFVAKGIQYFDDAYYNHSAVVYWSKNRLEMLDAWYGGVVKVPASRRALVDYKKGDFCVLRPIGKSKEELEEGIRAINERWHAITKYHYGMLLRIALIKKTGIDITGLSKRERTICSFTTRDFTNAAGIECYRDLYLPTPEDFLRFIDTSQVRVLFHTPNK